MQSPPLDAAPAAAAEKESQKDRESPNSPFAFPTFISKAVTFEEEVVFDHENSIDNKDSLDESPDILQSAPFWAMLGGEGEHWSAQELLGASIMSVTPGAKTLARSLDDSRSVEPNVSWQEDDDDDGSVDRFASGHSNASVAGKEMVASQLFSPETAGDDNDVTSDLSSNGHVSDSNNYSDSKENISMHSFQSSEPTLTPLRGLLDSCPSSKSVPLSSSPFSTFKQNSTSVELYETNFYVDRIEELERKLESAEASLATEEAKRVEAEQLVLQFSQKNSASTTAPAPPIRLTKTPSSKPVGLSPMTPAGSSASTVLPESLWERNMTLVKEVRFADQTCVELSGQKFALEQQVATLEENLEQTTRENDLLNHGIAVAEQARAHAEAESDSLRERLSQLETEVKEKQQKKVIETPCEDRATHCADLLVEKSREQSDIDKLLAERDNLLQTSDVLEKSLKDSQDQIKSLSAELENSRAKSDSLKSQLHAGHAKTKNAIERVVQAMNVQADAFGNNVVDRVSEMEAKLDNLSRAVFWMEEDLVFESEEESRSKSSFSETDDQHASGAPTVEDHSDDLIMMEEARSPEKQRSSRIGATPSQLDFNIEQQSPFSERTENMQSMSGLSESTVMESSDNDEKLLQHLQWMNSLDAVQHAPTTPGCTDPFTEDESMCRSKSAKKAKGEEHSPHKVAPRRLECTAARDDPEKQQQEAIGDLQDCRANPSQGNRGALYVRFESLQRQTEQVEEKLARKGIFPKTKTSPQPPAPGASGGSNQLSEQLVSLRKEKDEAYRELQNVGSALQASEATVDRLSKECESVHKEASALLVDKEKLQVVNSGLEKEVNRLHLEVLSEDAASKELDNLKTAHQLAKKRLHECEVSLQQALADKKQIEANKDAEVESLKAAQELANEQLRTLTSLQQALENKKQIEADNAKERERLSTELQLAKERLHECESSLRQALAVNKNLDAAKESVGREAQRLEKDLLTMEKEFNELKLTLELTELRLRDSEAALNQALEDNEILETARLSLETNVEQLEKAREDAEALEKEYEHLKVALQNAEDRTLEYESKLGQTVDKNKNLKVTNGLLEKEADRFQGKLLAAEAVTKELEQSRKTAVADAALYREKWSKLDFLYKEAEQKLKNLKDVEGQMKSAQSCVKEKEVESACLVQEVSHLTNLVGKEKAESLELQQKNSVLFEKCERLRAYVRKLTDKCDEWEIFHNRESQVLLQLKITLDRTRQEARVLANHYKQSDQVRLCC